MFNKSKPKETVYEIVSPKIGNIEKKTVATGNVEPRDEVLIKPQISGIVSELLKEPGQTVKVGDIIARVKVIPEMSSLSSAESRLKLSQISLDRVKQEYERQKKLYKTGVISAQEFEKIDEDFKRSQEELENARDNLDIIKEGISKKFAQYSNTQIRATISGMILDIPIKIGNSVIQSNSFNDGTTIASIANMGDMIFKGKIDETEVGRLHEGMPMILTIGALQEKKFDALLEYVSPKGVDESGAVLFEIKAAVKIPKDVFVRAGYSANAQIILDKKDSVLTIPESVVEFVNDSSFVYILQSEKPSQKFDRKYVKLGLSDGINVEVISGIDTKNKLRGMPKIGKP